MIGWDEILYGGLAEGAAVMSWRGNKGRHRSGRQRTQGSYVTNYQCLFGLYTG